MACLKRFEKDEKQKIVSDTDSVSEFLIRNFWSTALKKEFLCENFLLKKRFL